jgi:hypothetical protein
LFISLTNLFINKFKLLFLVSLFELDSVASVEPLEFSSFDSLTLELPESLELWAGLPVLFELLGPFEFLLFKLPLSVLPELLKIAFSPIFTLGFICLMPTPVAKSFQNS